MDRQIKRSPPMRHLVMGLLAFLAVATAHAQADILDLPDPGNPDSTYLPPTPLPETPPVKKPEVPPVKQPDAPPVTKPVVEKEKIGTLEIKDLSRKTGGSVYTVQLQKSLSLKSLDLEVKASPIKLIAVTLITDDGHKVQAADLSLDTVLESGAKISTALNQSNRVKAIQIKLESMGRNASIVLSAIGDRETPRLKLKVETPPAPPVPPTPPVAPPPSHQDNSRIIKGGDQVLYGNSYVARVISVNPQMQTANVKFETDGSTAAVSLNSLSRRVSCFGQICTGDQATLGAYTGRVLGVYANGQIQFRFDLDGSLGFSNTGSIAKATMCAGNICVGDSVLMGNYSAQVKQVFNNKMALIRFEDSSQGQVSTQSLAKEVPCIGQICPNDRVLLGTYTARAKKMYSNGMVQIIFEDSSKTFVNASSLAKAVACYGTICTGDRARLGAYSGKVLEVFNNGQARFRFEDSSTTMVGVRGLVK